MENLLCPRCLGSGISPDGPDGNKIDSLPTTEEMHAQTPTPGIDDHPDEEDETPCPFCLGTGIIDMHHLA
jgi:hypothetical protein